MRFLSAETIQFIHAGLWFHPCMRDHSIVNLHVEFRIATVTALDEAILFQETAIQKL
jgi:hypothetical protein